MADACSRITQFVCIAGVHRLTSRVSSLSVTLVLSLRKAVSLVISLWWFGGAYNYQTVVGAALVGFGTLLYSFGSGKRVEEKKAVEGKRE